MLTKILNSKTKTITLAAFILGSAALGSRILGLLRDRILAGKFGVGDELDIYFAAFRVPDLVYSILIMGAVSSAFIPVFSEYLEKNKKEAWRLVSNLLNIAALSLIILSLILIILTPILIKLITPGFEGEKLSLTIWLTRLMFLSPILFGIGSIFSGILQVFRKFLIFSLAPIFYNLGIIFGALYLTDFAQNFGIARIFGLGAGVILGAFLHLVIQIPGSLASGFKYSWIFNMRDIGVRKIIKLMLPRTVGLAAFQINLIVITAIASTLAVGSITVFNLANNLQYVPIGIIGISFATAAFPALSRRFAKEEKEKFIKTFSSTFRQILFLVIPFSVLIILLRAQIVRLILGTGEFGWSGTRLTAACLGLFGLSIFAQALTPLLSRTFYSFQDTKTPVALSIISIISNIVLSFFFVYIFSFANFFQSFVSELLDLKNGDLMEGLSVIGLPLAFSLASIINFALLMVFLQKRFGEVDIKKIFKSFWKIFLATILAGIVVYWALNVIADFINRYEAFNMQTFLGVFLQAAGATVLGILVYILLVIILKSPEFKQILNSFRRGF